MNFSNAASNAIRHQTKPNKRQGQQQLLARAKEFGSQEDSLEFSCSDKVVDVVSKTSVCTPLQDSKEQSEQRERNQRIIYQGLLDYDEQYVSLDKH